MGKVYPDYTPPPRPNVSTTPVPPPVHKSGGLVSTDDTREQIEKTLHIASPPRKIR